MGNNIITKRIYVFKKGLIPFEIKISYTYFNGKLFMSEGGYNNFKKSFRSGFWDLIGRDTQIIPLFKEDKYNTISEDFYKNYQKFFMCFSERKTPKPISYERRLEISAKIKKTKELGYALKRKNMIPKKIEKLKEEIKLLELEFEA